MKTMMMTGPVATLLMISTGVATAGCGIEGGSVRILSNDFEALHIVAEGAEACAGDGVEVTKNHTTEHKVIQVPALTTNPATYTVAMVANNSIVPLLGQGLIRPLDDLVAEYGEQLNDSQLIRIDGKIMAVAFMVNAQHSYYRKDVFEKAGLPLPKTYEDVLAAAKVIREKGIMQDPLGASLKPGFDIAAEFSNMYSGLGGEFFATGSAEASIENEQGVKALETLKEMTAFMGPDFMTWNTNAVKPIWEADQVAFWNGWGSRTGAFIDAEAPDQAIAEATVFGAAPTVDGGSVPASLLYWDGFSIAKNISDADATASFQAMMNGMSPDNILPEHSDVAAWLITGYEPTEASIGVIDTMKAGGKPYPMTPYFSLLFTALGDNLAEFMQGQESAEQALADTTTAYSTAAREAGFLN